LELTENYGQGFYRARIKNDCADETGSNLPNTETRERREGHKGGKEINGITGVSESFNVKGKE
jgi:hypothetical protein